MKDTFYFSHDYNARQDDKIKRLIMKHGFLGYGIFWAIIENLYNNANALRMDCELIAYEMRTTENVIESIINDFDLFVFDNDFFGSLSVERRLNERNNKSAKARESALLRWNKIKEDANALRMDYDSNAIKERKGKEIKEKENKEEINMSHKATVINKNFIIPTVLEITEYCLSRGNDVSGQKFFDFYESKGWLVGKNKMKDWKAAVRTWEKTNNTKSTNFTHVKYKIDNEIVTHTRKAYEENLAIYGKDRVIFIKEVE